MHGLPTKAAAAALLLLASAARGAQAIPPEVGAPITFDDALGLAARSPAVAGAAAAVVDQRRIGDSVSSVIENPTLNVQPGAGRDPLDGRWTYLGETTILQGWNLSGLPGDRKAAVRAEGEQLLAEARAVALSHRLAAAQVWMELWAAQQSLADSLQEADLARKFSERVARAAAPAAFTRAEVAAYAADAHVQALAAEGEVVDRGYQLAVAMGRETRQALVVAGPLPAHPAPERADWPALLEAAGKLPAWPPTSSPPMRAGPGKSRPARHMGGASARA